MVRHILNTLLERLKSDGVYVDGVKEQLEKIIIQEQKKVGFMDADEIDLEVEELFYRIQRLCFDDGAAPNGKIDENFQQGSVGDCWLLAAIKSISNNPKGRKISDESIKVNSDGSVTVQLKGVNKTYTITKKELYGSKELSTGDLDVRALEIAVNRYLKEEYYSSWDSHAQYNIEGNREDVAYDILLGTGKTKTNTGGWGIIYDYIFHCANNSSLIKKAKKGDAIINVATPLNITSSVCAQDTDGNEAAIVPHHAYSVIDADDDYVYLINPHDTSRILKMTHDDFKNTFTSWHTVDLT